MAHKLCQEEIVTLKTLNEKGQSKVEIGRTLGVSEGSVRYHLRRAAEKARDGRRHKPRKAEQVGAAIGHWMESHGGGESARPVNVKLLYEWLATEHGYDGSYKSVLRYVRAEYPKPRRRPFRRVETPPGAQAQVDWGEVSGVDLGDGPQKVYAFVMVLSHSRKEVVVWCRRMDQLAWQTAHNEAFRRLEGVPAVLRIDNLKTGIIRGAGPWGEINATYRTYARSVGFHIDACLPRSPEDKGKVENKVGQVKGRLHLAGKSFNGLEDLQAYSDEQLAGWAKRRVCPATGESVEAAWRAEQRVLQPLPLLPEVFDVVVTRPVHDDCTVNFENRSYSVPFRLCGLSVEVRGCAEVVQIVHEGRVAAEHPRGSRRRLLINPEHYEGHGDDRVMPPVPLGEMGRRLQEIALQPVEQRPLDLYAELAEVAR